MITIREAYTDGEFKSTFDTFDEKFVHAVDEAVRGKESFSSLLRLYIQLLQFVFGGFNVVKRVYNKKKDFCLVLTPSYQNNSCLLTDDAPSARYEPEVSSQTSATNHARGGSAPRGRLRSSTTELLLDALCLGYENSKGLLFEILDLVYSQSESSLPRCLHVDLNILSKATRENIMDSRHKLTLCTYSTSGDACEAYLCLNMAEFYFVLLFNLSQTEVRPLDGGRPTIYEFLMQNYISGLIPLNEWTVQSTIKSLSLQGLPILQIPPSFYFEKNSICVAKGQKRHAAGLEHFIHIADVCFTSRLQEKGFLAYFQYQPYHIPSDNVINYFYQISYRLVFHYYTTLESGELENWLTDVCDVFFTFITRFLLSSFVSTCDYDKLSLLVRIWILLTNPKRVLSEVDPVRHSAYVRRMLPLYLYGVRFLLDRIRKIKYLSKKLMLFLSVLENYNEAYFKVALVLFDEDQDATKRIVTTIHGYHGLTLEDCFKSIFVKLSVLHFQLVALTSGEENMRQPLNREDAMIYSELISIIAPLLQSWSGGKSTRNKSYYDFFTSTNFESLSTEELDNLMYLLNNEGRKDHWLIKNVVFKNEKVLRWANNLSTRYGGMVCDRLINPIVSERGILSDLINWKADFKVDFGRNEPPKLRVCLDVFASYFYWLAIILALILMKKSTFSQAIIILLTFVVVSLSLIRVTVDTSLH